MKAHAHHEEFFGRGAIKECGIDRTGIVFLKPAARPSKCVPAQTYLAEWARIGIVYPSVSYDIYNLVETSHRNDLAVVKLFQ